MQHQVRIYPEVEERVTQRRGNAHLYDTLDARKTALLVVDMQNCWVMEGQPGYSPYCPPLVPGINRLAHALRDKGGTVAWIQMNGSREMSAQWTRYREIFARQEVFEAWADALTPGNKGFEIWAGFETDPKDLRVEKNRYSAFIQGASNLQPLLDQRGIDTVLIAGTATNICCEATARDAQMLNYKVVMLSDANAARTDKEHNATLSNLFGMVGDVMTTNEAAARLQAG